MCNTNVKRKSVGTHFSMCVQPAFIIGTNNEDGTVNFAPITWVSVLDENDSDYFLVISMRGTKRTKQNVIRNGLLSANLVSTDMLALMDYFALITQMTAKRIGFHTATAGERSLMSRFWTTADSYMSVRWKSRLKQANPRRFSAV